MSKIQFEYEGKKYTLEFDRSTVAAAEQTLGVSMQGVRELRITMFPLLFQAAFLKHHRRVDPKLIDEIYECMPNKQELFMALGEMYAENIESLVKEPPKGKAISWGRA